jgi:hypothetical protein
MNGNPWQLVDRAGRPVEFRSLTRWQQARLVLSVVLGLAVTVATWKLLAYVL